MNKITLIIITIVITSLAIFVDLRLEKTLSSPAPVTELSFSAHWHAMIHTLIDIRDKGQSPPIEAKALTEDIKKLSAHIQALPIKASLEKEKDIWVLTGPFLKQILLNVEHARGLAQQGQHKKSSQQIIDVGYLIEEMHLMVKLTGL
jgi:hypothetical protein